MPSSPRWVGHGCLVTSDALIRQRADKQTQPRQMLLSCHMAMKALLSEASCVPRMCPSRASGTQASHGMAPALMRWLSRMRLTRDSNS